MTPNSPRQYFLSTTIDRIQNDRSQDTYVLELLQEISAAVGDDEKWQVLPEEERQEIEQLLVTINNEMERVVESKSVYTDPKSGESLGVMDTHATGLFRGGLINAIVRLKTKADNMK